MNVLIACEESQVVCKAFREKGHNAYSCDLLPCSGGRPEWHIKCDVSRILNPEFCLIPDTYDRIFGIGFITCDQKYHFVHKWDLIIAHPPCTRLCITGQRWLYYGSEDYRKQKRSEQEEAIAFFMKFVYADCDRIVIENPVGIMSSIYRKPDCIYNPYDFEGETECKKTCLWLLGDVKPLRGNRVKPLPVDQRTHGIFKACFNGKQFSWNDPDTARLRSQTLLGVAKAMADQWGV